jgi:hypothetical protein
MTTKLTDKNISNVSNLGLQWQSVITADGSTTTTAVAGQGYFIDTTSAAHTINLPASATAGDTIAIKDYAGTFGTNALTIGRNGHNIQGVTNDSQISTARANVELVYSDATKGWLYTVESNVADLQLALYITATGGTVTTSGDFKIHSFTGDGCFVVSCAGNPVGSTAVDYLVVAGGGGGGAGGGAGGGFRVSNSYGLPGPTMSPLSNPTGLTVTSTTYPVTVGAGGSAGAQNAGGAAATAGGCGSNSIFSTITSTAGGGGGSATGSSASTGGGRPGGSGGGNGHDSSARSVATGNTPPVSPPQGNNGGIAPTDSYGAAAGGGGAGAVGSNQQSPNNIAGGGGIGSYVSPSFAVGCAGTTGPVGSTRYFSGGGGGGNNTGTGTGFSHPSGGAGGGGPGGKSNSCFEGPSAGTAGTANTGGGGGGHAHQTNADGAAGGKGIVILRYKFQN